MGLCFQTGTATPGAQLARACFQLAHKKNSRANGSNLVCPGNTPVLWGNPRAPSVLEVFQGALPKVVLLLVVPHQELVVPVFLQETSSQQPASCFMLTRSSWYPSRDPRPKTPGHEFRAQTCQTALNQPPMPCSLRGLLQNKTSTGKKFGPREPRGNLLPTFKRICR